MEAAAKTQKKIYSTTELVNGLKQATGGNQKRVLQEEFYRRFRGHVFKISLNPCRNFNDAEQLAVDLVQDTFIKAFQAIERFKFPEDNPEVDHRLLIEAWLGKIARNCFRRLYAKIKMDVIFDDDIVYANEPLYDLFEEMYGDEKVETTNELRVRLQVALNQLTDRQKHIVFVYAGEGCIDAQLRLGDNALTELCSIYDTTPENIRQIKKRSLDKIKAICFPETTHN
jgi:RNA polymerase sigma factor (sigma-70 family)